VAVIFFFGAEIGLCPNFCVELFFAITENNKDIERRPDEQKATAINIYPQKGRKFYFQHVSHLRIKTQI
jgi:hypothetical protein